MPAGDLKDVASIAGLTDLGAGPNGRHVCCQGAAPGSWLLCNGAEVEKATYPALWAVLDDGGSGLYGVPVGGSSFFVLPDARARVTGFYRSDVAGFHAIGTVAPVSGVHFTPTTGSQNAPQWLTVGGKLIKT